MGKAAHSTFHRKAPRGFWRRPRVCKPYADQPTQRWHEVKIVLAASMWQNPHILILDEPTNYLDREGLGALVLAIKDYKGGVLIISHNKEFCENVATEKWIMKGGYLRIEGESKANEDEEQNAVKANDDVYDGAGNKIDVKLNQKLSAKDAK